MLGQNNASQTPSQSDLQRWASTYGLTHPVVADPNFQVSARFIDGSTIALPSMTLIRAGGEIIVRGGWVGESQVAANLP